jgi:hypothetical protein
MRANDFDWGFHKPGEVAPVCEGWPAATSPSSRLINEHLRGAW